MKSILTSASLFLLFLAPLTGFSQVTGDTSVCAGDLATYSAPNIPGAVYSWSVTTGSITGISMTDTVVINWPAAGTGTVMVTVVLPNNSTAVYFLNVTIHALPDPQITHAPYPTCPPGGGDPGTGSNPDHGGDDLCEKVCPFATVTYTTAFQAGHTYQWVVTGAVSITGAGTNAATVTWDASALGTLVVYETNAWGCVDSSRICVEKADLPVAFFTHPATVCNGTTVTFTNQSSGGVSFQWDFGDGGNSSQPSPSHIYNSGGTFTITLIAISACHCADTFQSTLTVNALPGPEISCPSTVCAFDTGTYTASGTGCSYAWFAAGGSIVGPSNQQSVTVAWGPGQVGQLGVIATGCGGLCADTTWISIPIIPATGVIAGPGKVCPGSCEEYSLPLFSGSTYTWSLNSGSCGTLSDSVCCDKVEICWPPYVYPCTDTLTVTFWDPFLNCGGTASMVIRVRPELAIFGQQQACSNGNSGFYASPGINSTWTVTPPGPVVTPGPSPSAIVNWSGFSGTYLVTATPANPNHSCNDSATVVVNVILPPTAPQITGDTVVCLNSTRQYCTSGNGNTQWLITGGTPSAGTGNCITVTWGNTPPFVVKAYNTMLLSPFCSSDTTTQSVTTFVSLPVPAFTGSHQACANGTSTLSTPTNYPPGSTFTWDLSPGNAGTVISGQGTGSILIEWGNNAPQTVVVGLNVSACGLNISDTFHITLNPPPSPVIVQNGNLCPGVPAQLTATGGAFTGFQWSGPGGFSSTGNPVTITQPGLYQLTVTDAGGCTALTQLTVFNSGAPVASITSQHPLSYCLGTPFNVNLCALGNPNYAYAWSNGATTQCNAINVPGSYQVTVTDLSNGCINISNTLTISVQPCQPDTGSCVPAGSVSFTHSGCNPKSFTNTSVNASSFFWNFGDLGTSNATNPTHTYTQAGFYTVTLNGYVPNAAGTDSCLVTDTALIEIPLVARFAFTYGCYSDPVCFTDMSVMTAGNNITSWNWNFGDANTSPLQNPCHTYATAGTYIVTLTISNGPCTTSVTDTVTILPAPAAAFTAGSGGCTNSALPFTDNSVSGINYWNWDFGNGGTSLNQNPSQAYALPGIYPVTLIVHDSAGCYDTVTQNITVNAPQVSGNITAFPDTVVCAGTLVVLAAPSCTTCTYAWSNGSLNDSITVTSTGIYAVTVTDLNGCTYSALISIIVNPPPSAAISAGNNSLCLLQSTSLSVPYNPDWLYQWISNDTTVNGATAPSVGIFATTPGLYSYQVLITDTLTGCADTTLAVYVAVHLPPAPPSITPAGPSTVCQGDTVTLVASHPDPSVDLVWSTGQITDTIQVTENGCYFVVAEDSNACTSQTNYCVTVNPLPELCSFYVGCFDTCAPYLIQGPSGAASYQWLFNGLPLPGDTLQNYLATVSGSYSVIVTNSYGCTDTTGGLNLTLTDCPGNQCATLLIDTVLCDPATGQYILNYQVVNLSNQTATLLNLQVLPPNLGLSYSPSFNAVSLLPGDTSGVLSATIYNGTAGDTLCFRTYLSALDSTETELLGCYTDTVCIVLPPCGPDTSCCSLSLDGDSIWCTTSAAGQTLYHFSIQVSGCGNLSITNVSPGALTINYPPAMTGGTYVITGTFVPISSSALCLLFIVGDGQQTCADLVHCIPLPACPPPGLPCEWGFTPWICEGGTAVFQHYISMPGTTYTWNFPGGIPSTATGMGPHSVTYPVPGTYPVQVVLSNAGGQVICSDSITVLPRPAASIAQTGTSLTAQPTGMAYQWYSYPVSQATLIMGANGQVYSPSAPGTYCVVVSSAAGCSDTACIDFNPACCYFTYYHDSIWCETGPDGTTIYQVSLTVSGCGNLSITNQGTGILNLSYPPVLSGGTTVITGTFSPANDGLLCMLIMVGNAVTYCADTTVCLELPGCPPPGLPCEWGFTPQVCAGETALFQHYVYMAGTTYTWSFPGGFPATASGMGPHGVVYPVPGTYLVQLVLNNASGQVICSDSIEVLAPPAASISQNGPALFAQPPGMSYQWYAYPVSQATLIAGATGQGFTPGSSGTYCVVVTDVTGCADTACLDFTGGCCDFSYLGDSVWCETTANGDVIYQFTAQVSGCGTLTVSPLTTGILGLTFPQVMTGGIYVISGSFTPPSGNQFCLLFMVNNGTSWCADNTYCLDLPPCGGPADPCDSLTAQFQVSTSGLSAQFTNTSAGGGGLILTSFSWNFGDPASGNNNVSSLMNPSHVFSGPGTFTVCLIVGAILEGNEPVFCFDTVCLTVTVTNIIIAPDPWAGNDVTIYLGASTLLNGTATGGEPPYTFHWTPEEGLNDPYIPNPLASPDTTTIYTLEVTDILGNTGTDSVTVTVIPAPFSTITGTVTYDNATGSPLGNVSVMLWKDNELQGTAITDPSGGYTFTGVLPGTYQLTCSSDQAWGGVNATDALVILKQFAGMTTLGGIRLKAANLDAVPVINAVDALLASRRFAGMITGFYVGDWVFENPVVVFTGDSIVTRDIKGLCTGDVNGSNNPGLREEPSLRIEAQGTLPAVPGYEIRIPFRIQDNTVVAALSLVLAYPAEQIEVLGIDPAPGMESLVYRASGGELRMAWYGLEPVLLEEGGTVFEAVIRVVTPASQPGERNLFRVMLGSELAGPDASSFSGNTLMIPALVQEEGRFFLGQNVPNPVYSDSRVVFSLPAAGQVRLVLLGLAGNEIRVLTQAAYPGGVHEVTVSVESLPAGVYFYRMEYFTSSGQFSQTRQMVIGK